MHGSLPWQGSPLQGDKRQSFVQKKKQNMLVDVICKGLPEKFECLLKYACVLKFSEWPDYGYLHELFSNLHQDAGEGLESLTSCFSDNFINLDSNSSRTQEWLEEPDPGMGMRK